jgi:hypothetical protein
MKLMSLRIHAPALFAGVVLVSLLLAGPALAQVNHGNFSGTTVDFNDVTETTQLGVDPTDPAVLFGVPTASGNELAFDPLAFASSATPSNGRTSDDTLSLLSVDIISSAIGTYIEDFTIREAGDSILTGFAGSGATGTFVAMSGIVTVKEANGVPLPGGDVFIPINAIFTQDLFLLPGDIGAINWLGEAFIDVAAVVPNATWVHVALNNYLGAARDPAGNYSATIQKKAVRGVVITVPEPSSMTLIGLGLLFGVAVSARGRKD